MKKTKGLIVSLSLVTTFLLAALAILSLGAFSARAAISSRVYFSDFEDGATADFTCKEGCSAQAETAAPIAGEKSLKLSFTKDETESAAINDFVCENDTVYTVLFQFKHAGGEGNYWLNINSASANYAGFRINFADNTVLSAKSVNGETVDRKNYELTEEDDYNVLKFVFWSGFESDWGIKFGASGPVQPLIVDGLAIYKGVEIDTNAYFGAKDGLKEDAENGTLFGGAFVSCNYSDSAALDGRITADKNEVITGKYSVAASAKDVSDWQPFIQSVSGLKINTAYTVAFDYKWVSGGGKMGVNIGTTDDYYRVFYLGKDGFISAEAGMTDAQIGTEEQSGWYGNYYGDHNCAYYVINRGAYYSVKFTFINCAEDAKMRFIMPNNGGNDDDTRYVFDNIRVTKGTNDLYPANEDGEDVPVTMFCSETFDRSDSENYSLSLAKIDTSDEEKIAGEGSLHAASQGNWNDFVTFKQALMPNATYTLTFKYRINSAGKDSFAYINIKNTANADDASYLGFDASGAYSGFSGGVIAATVKKNFTFNTAAVTLLTKSAGPYKLVIGAKGAVNLLLDDLVVVTGETPAFNDETQINKPNKRVAAETFENGYGIFSGLIDGKAPVGRLAYAESEVINGSYSMKGTSNSALNWVISSDANTLALEGGAVYTVLFRFSASNNAKIYLAMPSSSSGVQKSLAVVDYKGRRIKDYDCNVLSTRSLVSLSGVECRVILSAPEDHEVTLRFGVADGAVLFDDVQIYKGMADVSYSDECDYISGGTARPGLSDTENSARQEASCTLPASAPFTSLEIHFTQAVILSPDKTITGAVTLSGKSGAVPITASLLVAEKKIIVTWQEGALIGGETYTLKAEGFLDAYGTAADPFEKSFVYGTAEETPDGPGGGNTDGGDVTKPGCGCGGNLSSAGFLAGGAFAAITAVLLLPIRKRRIAK